MNNYSLGKSSKKFHCPICKKQTFVRHADNASNQCVNLAFDRCDRKSKCKYHQKPQIENSIIEKTTEIETMQGYSKIDKIHLVIHGRNFKENNCIQFLKLFLTTKELQTIILQYLIGTSSFWKASTIFWQINNKKETQADTDNYLSKKNKKAN